MDEALADAAYADDRIIPGSFEVPAIRVADPRPLERVDGPASEADVRGAYLDQGAIGYVIYAVGAVSAYIAVGLTLSDAQAGLHSSLFAVGMVAAGIGADRLDRLIGARTTHVVALAAMAVATSLLAWAPSFAATLTAAGVLGAAVGVLLGHVNRTVAAGGGPLARVRLARSSLAGMVGPLAVPLVIGLGVTAGLGWQAFVLPALGLIAAGLVFTLRRSAPPPQPHRPGSLPSAFWHTWALIVLVVAIEFGTVVWSSAIIEARVGATLTGATVVLAAFVAGVIVGRAAISLGRVSRIDPMRLFRLGVGVTFTGSMTLWLSPTMEVSGLGLFLAGLGVGVLYPLGASIALSLAPGHPHKAAARLVLGSGLAILVAPLVLGVAADLTVITIAWLLVPALAVVAMALSVPVGRYARA